MERDYEVDIEQPNSNSEELSCSDSSWSVSDWIDESADGDNEKAVATLENCNNYEVERFRPWSLSDFDNFDEFVQIFCKHERSSSQHLMRLARELCNEAFTLASAEPELHDNSNSPLGNIVNESGLNEIDDLASSERVSTVSNQEGEFANEHCLNPASKQPNRSEMKAKQMSLLAAARHLISAPPVNWEKVPTDENDVDENKQVCRVSWEGINPQWLTETFFQTPEVQRFIQFGCRMWFLRHYGIQEMLRRRGNFSTGAAIDYVRLFEKSTRKNCLWKDTLGRPAKAPATAFISFTGSYTIQHFLHLIQDEHLRDKYVWIDTFSIDQFAWTCRKDDSMKMFKKNFMYELAKKLGPSDIRYFCWIDGII